MRVKEIGIRKVVGSSQKHLVGLFIAEALLVNFIATVVAFFSRAAVPAPFLVSSLAKTLNPWQFGVANTLLAVTSFFGADRLHQRQLPRHCFFHALK